MPPRDAAKHLMVSKTDGGFTFFNCINEKRGMMYVDYCNGTTSQIHIPKKQWSLVGLSLALQITIIAVIALILFKLALCVGCSYINTATTRTSTAWPSRMNRSTDWPPLRCS